MPPAGGDPGPGRRARQPAADLPPAPRHPLRRHGDLRPAGDRGVPGGVGPDARPHRAAVGQGRLRGRRAGQVRPARARHALRAAPDDRPGRPSTTARRSSCTTAADRPRSTTCSAGRLGRGVPGGEPGADGHPAPAEAAGVLRPGRRGGADPARPDPGRLGAPVHPPPQRPGAREHDHPLLQQRAGEDARRAAVPGAADADGDRRGRLRRRPTPTSCAGPWAPSAPPSGWRSCAAGSTPGWPPTGSPASWPTRSSTKMLAFANYGFPESHAISFAYLVYASAWLKRYHPAAFCAALLNAQPMGFYSPQSLVDDARRHGVQVRGPGHQPRPGRGDAAARPGQRGRAGRPAGAGRGARDRAGAGRADRGRARAGRAYRDMADLARRVRLTAPQVEALATADAFACFGATGPAGGAVGGRGGGRGPAGPAAGHRGRPGRADAARADRRGAHGGRRVGHRAVPGQPPDPVPAGAAGRPGRGADRPAGRGSAATRRSGGGSGAGPAPGAGRRDRHAPAAAGHRGRDHLPQPRGRDRHAQRHLLAGAVAALPQGGPGSSALLVRGRLERPGGGAQPGRRPAAEAGARGPVRSRDFR